METLTENQLSVYSFGNKKADGSRDMKNLLGGKGANLAEMSRIGKFHRGSRDLGPRMSNPGLKPKKSSCRTIYS